MLAWPTNSLPGPSPDVLPCKALNLVRNRWVWRDLAMMRARLTSKGQITIPKEVRERLGVGQGDSLEFSFEGGRVEVRPIRRRNIAEFRGLFPVEEVLDFAEERARARAARVARLVEAASAQDA